jgi:hypothetical protein
MDRTPPATQRDRDGEAAPPAAITATVSVGRAYIGLRRSDRPGDASAYVLEDGEMRPLTHYPYHSPSGFEWGYGGSGPADLALALLADVLGEEPTREALDTGAGRFRSWLLHQDLKADLLVGLPHGGWRVSAGEVAAWAEGRLRELAEAERD